jgi:hypothetical protein|nr:MAG TPA: hypothetical protein [Caudoviricetes sp.]
MLAKQYDFASFNEFMNKIATPSGVCDQLMDLVFNYSWCINEETVDRFKDDITTIYMLLGEFKKLAEQN